MTGPADPPSALGAPVTADALAAAVAARAEWLAEATAVLHADPRVAGVVLVGSLAGSHADAFSDVDLIVAVHVPVPDVLLADPFAGLGLPGIVLYRRPKPRNAPAGGTYLAVCLELAGLPVMVDLYLWPANTAAVPAGGRILVQRGVLPGSELGLLDLLARCPATDTTGWDPDDPATQLLLIQLAAKYHARGDQPRRAGICHRLQLADIDSVADLRELLGTGPPLRDAAPSALAAVHRLLDLVSVLTSVLKK